MPLELRRTIDVDEESQKTIHSLMGINNTKFCKVLDNYKYMRKHNMPTTKQDKIIENLIFAKNFFAIIDIDDSGEIDITELALPLISLGLATDSEFIKKALKVLHHKKYSTGDFTQEITMKEFSSIF
jgi:hypothetical protein